jgi:hypothetical protein
MAVLLGGLLLMQAYTFTVDDTYAAIEQASATSGVSAARLERIVDCETGHTMDPHAIGDYGTSYGAVQLHRGGLLGHFYSVGYDDPFDPYQAVQYLADSILAGKASAWTCR